MKRLLFISIAVILAGMLIFSGCAKEETTPAPTPAPAPAPSPVPAPSLAPTPTTTPTQAGPTPVYGGVLKRIASALPRVLGYTPEFSPTETIFALPVLERLNEWGEKGVLQPVLAESWEGDMQAKIITWHLRQGVKFQDGTDWNAEALRWNFQLLLDANRLPAGKYVKSLEVVNEYTLKMYLTEINWLRFEDYGFMLMISPTAFKAAGGGDFEKSKTWARMNPVGTGAFKVSEFQRDVVIKYVKNNNYWRKGMPYLDGIEVQAIPDPMVASAKLEAGEVDMLGTTSPQIILDFQKKGFKINFEPGMVSDILFNSKDPNSKFANKKVREAFEYAIDRPTITDLLGQGLYKPMTQLAPPDTQSYIEGYYPRPYNPEKARQLLAEAGYPSGFKAKMLCTDASRNAVTLLKSFLGEVGIIIDPDVADMGRYFGAVFGTGWEELVFGGRGINPDGKEVYIHFGPAPTTYISGNIYKSPEFLAKCAAGLDPSIKSAPEAMPKIKEIIKQGTEDAMVVPIYKDCNVQLYAPYVHTDYPKIHGMIWTPYDDWMEKH